MQSRIVGIYKNEKLNIVIKFDDATGENRQEQNPCCPHIPDHPHGMLIVGDSGLGKTNVLLNLMS